MALLQTRRASAKPRLEISAVPQILADTGHCAEGLAARIPKENQNLKYLPRLVRAEAEVSTCLI